MPRAISYFIFSSNGSYLRWDDDTTIDFLIRQYEMSITGGGGVDRLYVGAGTKVDAGALFASANTDELYLSGNFSDYTQTISAGGVYTFTGLAGGSHANEVVSFSMNSNGDKLVFANGHVTVKSSDYLTVAGSYSSILAGSLTLIAQTDPTSGAQPGNKPAKVFVFDAGGINIPQLPIVDEAIAVSGGGGVDKFYVRKGTNADAIGLFASAGQDVLYLTGRFDDYTQTKSAGGVYTFTRNFTDAADASLTEVVSFSMNSSGDQLVFADGGVALRLADYLTGGTYADITAGQLNRAITTPGLLPSLRLVSDTGFSSTDNLTNNPTIKVISLYSGATWNYQVDNGSWMAGGTGTSFSATSGTHTYLVRQIDAAGNTSAVSVAATYTLDATAPVVPTLSLASDTGTSPTDGLTNNATIKVQGLETAVGTTWAYQADGTVGAWIVGSGTIFTATGGTHSYSVRQTDAAGNTGAVSTAVIYTLVPLALAPTLRLASDTGYSASDGITSTPTINITGLVNGNTWQYQVDAGGWQTGTGSSFIATSGAHAYFVRQIDTAGNTSVASTAVTYTLDTTPPAAPSLMGADDTIVVNSLETTTGTTWRYQVDSGGWQTGTGSSFIASIGAHSYSVQQTDAAGNTSNSNSTTYTYTLHIMSSINLANVGGTVAGFSITGEAAYDRSGSSVSAAGDVNGDGLADLLVGAPWNGAGGIATGRSYVVFGKANISAVNLSALVAGTGGFAITGEAANDHCGYSVSAAGDVNGDGLADLLVGAPQNSEYAGRSYVVFGKANTNAVSLNAVAAGTGGFAITGETSDFSGWSVAAAGDVNGDGFADLLVGAPQPFYVTDSGLVTVAGTGRSYVVFGKTNTSAVNLSTIVAGTGGFSISGETADDYSGRSVSAAGDVNGDGLADLLVGAPSNNGAGRSYVVFGKANTSAIALSAIAAGSGGFAITGEASYYNSGWSVSAAGDVNGDGLADLLVGADDNNFLSGDNAGRSYVVFGKANTNTVSLSAVALGTGGFVIGEAANIQSGWSVSLAGDVNGDGLGDLLVGAPNSNDAGRSYVVFGKTNTSAVNLSAIAAGTGGFAITGEVANDHCGYSVSAAGDINGDGLADLFVGSPYNNGQAGRCYVIFGGTQWISAIVQGSGTVTGTSANEAIIGSSGVDVLTGSGGVDRYFAGAGNDVFVLTASDIANLASKTVSGSVRAIVDGGSDIDTICLSGGANLDLTAIANIAVGTPTINSRISSIERIDLATNSATNTLTLGVADVLDMAGFNSFNTGNGWTNATGAALSASVSKHQLVIDGTATDRVQIKDFASAWTRSQTVSGTNDIVSHTENSTTRNYYVYNSTSGNAQLLIDTGITPTTIVVISNFTVIDGIASNGKNLGKSGETLTFTVTMSETVTVTGGGTPTITFNLNGQPVTASYLSGSGTNTLVFGGAAALVPATGDGNTISVTSINLNGATVTGQSSNQGWLTTAVEQTYTGYTVDNTKPSVSSLTLVTASTNAPLNYGDMLTAIVTMSEVVTVIGMPQLALNIGNTMVQANYAAGSGSSRLTFIYTLAGSLFDSNGISIGANALSLNSGAIQDTAGHSMTLTTRAISDLAAFAVDTVNVRLSAIAAGRGGFAMTGEADNHFSGRELAAPGNSSGSSVSTAGDVNGDGFADLLVGAPLNDAGGIATGRSYVVFGKTNWSDVSTLNLNAIAAGTGGFAMTGVAWSGSGASVSAAGDINGDGLADLLIGAPNVPINGNGAYWITGYSYVVFGKINTSGVNLIDVVAGTGGFAIRKNDYGGGFNVSAAGDVNGDGLADLLVGGYVVFGKASTSTVNLSTIAAGTGGFAIGDGSVNRYQGHGLASAGDVNGDGLADLLVGSPYADPAGRSYVVFGKTNTSAVALSAIVAGTGGFAITGEAANDRSGWSVSAAGDVNGDGLADLLIGAPQPEFYNNVWVTVGSGRSYVVFGKTNWSGISALNLSTIAAGTGGFAITGEAGNDQSGFSVSAAGDVNGDGLADLLVGAPHHDEGWTGRSYVVFGKVNTSMVNLSQVATGMGGFAITSEAYYDNSGYSVSAAGDINGDGLADLLVGAPGNDAGGAQAGRSYVIFGGTQWISNTVQGSGMVTGTSTSEAIIGSSDADVLTGGGGVDRYFAGAGNDIIVLTASDITNLASNVPTAVTGGSVRATVDGGTGIDTIRLSGGANLDLTRIANIATGAPKISSRIASIERIDLATDSTANTLFLRVGDVLDMAGFNLFNTSNGWTVSGTVTGFGATTSYHQLVVDGTSADTVVSAYGNGWVKQTGTVSSLFSGSLQSYNVYINTAKNAMLLADTGVTQTGVVSDGSGGGDADILLPILSITAVVDKAEGNSGTTNFNFTVTRSGSGLNVASSVHWEVFAGTASYAAKDFVQNGTFSGTFNFAAGETSKTISVPVLGNTLEEADKNFYVQLSQASNGYIDSDRATGLGIIRNDDARQEFTGALFGKKGIYAGLADWAQLAYAKDSAGNAISQDAWKQRVGNLLDENNLQSWLGWHAPTLDNIYTYATGFNISASYSNGAYVNKNCAAVVAQCGSNLVISFRGTDETADQLQWSNWNAITYEGAMLKGSFDEYPGSEHPTMPSTWEITWHADTVKQRYKISDFGMPAHYALFAPLISALDSYITSSSISNVYVTGHSLGAAMVNAYMTAHNDGGGVHYEAVTYADPGYPGASVTNADTRITNFWNDNDPINTATWFNSTPGDDNTFKIPTSLDPENDNHSMTYYQSCLSFIESQGVPRYYIGNPQDGAINYDSFIFNASSTTSIGNGNDDLDATLKAVMLGGAGNDILDCGSPDDWINGGSGSDTMEGGLGANVFAFNAPLNANDQDRITDFVHNLDKIWLYKAVYSALLNNPSGYSLDGAYFSVGSSANSATNYVYFDSDQSKLWYDADGNGAGGAYLIAITSGIIGGNHSVSYSDIVVI